MYYLSMTKDTSLINSKTFSYFMGYFAADGCFYHDKRAGTCRFEFSDGYSEEKELKYSYEFLSNLKALIEKQLLVKLPNLRKRKNKYVLNFKNETLERLFKEEFNINPGPKTYSIKIPLIYKDSKLEKYFWLGVMDGDGVIAKNGKKIALEVSSRDLVLGFQSFLLKHGIITKMKEVKAVERKNGFSSSNSSFLIIIRAPFYYMYAKLIGFTHPRKKSWLIENLKSKTIYTKNYLNINKFLIDSDIIDYIKIFGNRSVYIVNGKDILRKYKVRLGKRGNNVKFPDIYKNLNKDLSKVEVLREISNYRLKMGKGFINSVRVPFKFDENVQEIAKFVRVRGGSIWISRNYITCFNKDPDNIINNVEETFDIKPTYTSKKEPIFCSGVLNLFFSGITKGGVSNN